MLLKRVYDHSSGQPELSHVKVLRAGKAQKFSTRFVEAQAAAGILTLGGGKITIKTADGEPDLVYRIVRGPGTYCATCDAPVSDGAQARTHIAQVHDGAASPDPNNPAGYRRDHFYYTEREG